MKELIDLFYESMKTADVAGDSGQSYMGRRIKQVIFKEDMQDLYDKILDWHKEEIKKVICSTAPYPECNGANGCDTCEHQKEE